MTAISLLIVNRVWNGVAIAIASPTSATQPQAIPPIHVTVSSTSTTAWIAIVISALGIILSVLSFYTATKGHRTSEKTLRAKIGWDTFSLLEGDGGRTRKQRHLLQDIVAANGKEPPEILKAIDKLDAGEELHELMRAYDKAGQLARHGAIPLDFLFDFYSRPIAEAWKYLKPFVERLRVDSGHENHLKQFEILAIGAAIYRREEEQMRFHPTEDEIFPIGVEGRELWYRWSKDTWIRMRDL